MAEGGARSVATRLCLSGMRAIADGVCFVCTRREVVVCSE